MTAHRPYIVTGNVVNVTNDYFVQEVLSVFTTLSQGTKPKERNFLIAGKGVCMCFFDDVLERTMTQAFLHLEVPTLAQTDLTVNLWDRASSGLALTAPWSKPEYVSNPNAVDARGDSSFIGVYVRGEDTLTLYDRDSQTAYFWTRDAEALPRWVVAAPLRTLLHWFLADEDVHLIHGAAVAHEGKGALLTAPGGSGKSTTALTCLLSGMQYLADDYVSVRNGKRAEIYSLFSSVKVSPQYVRSFDTLAAHAWNTEGEKSIVFLSQLFPKQLIERVSLSVILVPVLAGGEKTVIMPTSKASALFAIAPTTLFQLPLARTKNLASFRNLVEHTPCYRMELSRDSQEASAVLKEFLTRIT